MSYILYEGVKKICDTYSDSPLKAIKRVRQLIAVMLPATDLEIYENKEQGCFYVHIRSTDILKRDTVLCLRESE